MITQKCSPQYGLGALLTIKHTCSFRWWLIFITDSKMIISALNSQDLGFQVQTVLIWQLLLIVRSASKWNCTREAQLEDNFQINSKLSHANFVGDRNANICDVFMLCEAVFCCFEIVTISLVVIVNNH